MKRLLPLAALAFIAQCTCGVPGVHDDLYPCRTDGDCVSTYACVAGRCRPKGTQACPTVDCSDPACDGRPCGGNGRVCSGRACACEANGGVTQPSEQACGDEADNDCDGLTDCADDTCNGQPCGDNGTCGSGGICVCAAAGSAPQAVENLCSDGLDNDCDGLTDCTDPSCGNVGCGANGRICIADAGACQCGGNGGTREGSESFCGDLADNDCDGLTDCADDTCNGQMCRPSGFLCTAMVCQCTGNGGTPQPTETSCTDTFDNDCDGTTDCADSSCDGVSCGAGCRCMAGAARELNCTDGLTNDLDALIDCADPDCDAVACGMNGLRCSMGACRCVVDGGMVQVMETLCGDGRDNDCNGATDCAEAACDGQSCGVGGRICIGNTCTCFVDGGVMQATETACSDGRDNDCDGMTDCADSSCNAQSCGTGCTCSGGARTETLCNDGVDNDGDGQMDCADSQCNRRQCGVTASSVCCGTTCRNLSTDVNNCGGCGTTCAGGFTCIASTSSGTLSGRCGCNGNGQCPLGQNCAGGAQCACSGANECQSGQMCGTSTCRY